MATTGTLLPHVPPQFLDGNGDPAASCLLFTYSAGTTNKLATYTTSTISGGSEVANANPIVLDASGRTAGIFLAAASYKFVLAPATDTDPPTSPIWTRDNISSIPFYNVSSTLVRQVTRTAWTAADNVMSLNIGFMPQIVSNYYWNSATGTSAIDIPAGTLATTGEAVICEWEVSHGSADLDARATICGTSVDLGTGAASTLTRARYVCSRVDNNNLFVSQTVHQLQAGGVVSAMADTNIAALDFDANDYTVALLMASGTYAVRGARVFHVMGFGDWGN